MIELAPNVLVDGTILDKLEYARKYSCANPMGNYTRYGSETMDVSVPSINKTISEWINGLPNHMDETRLIEYEKYPDLEVELIEENNVNPHRVGRILVNRQLHSFMSNGGPPIPSVKSKTYTMFHNCGKLDDCDRRAISVYDYDMFVYEIESMSIEATIDNYHESWHDGTYVGASVGLPMENIQLQFWREHTAERIEFDDLSFLEHGLIINRDTPFGSAMDEMIFLDKYVATR